MVGAGAVVTHDVPPNAIVTGNPAQHHRLRVHRGALGASRSVEGPGAASSSRRCRVDLGVGGATLHHLPLVNGPARQPDRSANSSAHLPFVPRRYFVVFNVPSQEVRGEHAHRNLPSVPGLPTGSGARDGRRRHGDRDEVVLDRPDLGLYVPPMVWAAQFHYSPDAVLLVLASDVYDADDYIRSYDEFRSLVLGGQ